MDALLLLFLLVPPQDPTGGEIRGWVETLRSEKIEEREEAARKLKGAGALAARALERASRDGDPEAASRARFLLRVIEIQARLTPNLKALLPGIGEHLAVGEVRTWTELFFEALPEGTERNPRRRRVEKDDLESLLPEAIAGLRTSEEKWAMLREVRERRLGRAGRWVLGLLGDDDGHLCKAAAHTLRKLGWDQANPEFISLLKSPDADKRRIPLWALKGFDLGPAVREILELIRSEDQDTRLAALRAAGELNLVETNNALLAILREGSSREDVLEAAAVSLGRLTREDTVAELVPLLRSDRPWIRRCAALALAESDARDAIPGITALLKDPRSEVRDAAIEAVGRLDAVEAAQDLLDLSRGKHLDGGERLHVLKALVGMRAAEAAREFEELLKSDQPHVRREAVEGLGKLGARGSAGEIAVFLRRREEGGELLNVQLAAIDALGLLEAEDAVGILKPFLEDPKGSWVRGVAASSLCRMGLRDAAAPLVEAVEEFRHGVRGGPVDDEEPEFAPLNPLNALRQPEVWRKLHERPAWGTLKGTTSSLLARIAERAGVRLEVPETTYWKEELWMVRGGWIRSRRGQVSLREALEELLPGEPYAFVLEPDRIRVLSTRDALAFWKGWVATASASPARP